MPASDVGMAAVLNDHFDVSRSFLMGLATTAQSVGGTITNEIAYTSYAQQAVTAPTDFDDATAVGQTNGTVINKQITFPQVDGGTSQQQATHWFLAVSTTVYHWGEIIDPVGGIIIDDNVTPQFDADQIEVFGANP